MDYQVSISSGYNFTAKIVDRKVYDVRITNEVYDFKVDLKSIVQVNYGFMEYATKSSDVDEGVRSQLAFDDDYLYFCTKTGTAGNAIWKKTMLING